MPGSGLRLLSICGEKVLRFLQPLLIVLFLLPTVSFFLGIFLLITLFFFKLLEPNTKPGEINGKFSVDLASVVYAP